MKSMFYLTKEELYERGLSLEEAEKLANFISDAKKSTLKFTYKKKDGTIRNAVGTINVSVIKEHPNVLIDEFELEYLEDIFENEELPEGSVPFDTNLVQELKVLYYDLEQNAIRSFYSNNLISWEFGDLESGVDEES